ncbi:hypothetical protein AK812_SmicGene33222 [Symbiodinium microadriaticum]|uniref:EF-hand domain-containing protein n=1 Tax=Symbiodinium microadriaticum TaxID=2951 RepID=A0A1Q9CS64_SYMMI|nr:hypothetical protein AK812_SmicGene33222 [Symbiodinium microadriaticum]
MVTTQGEGALGRFEFVAACEALLADSPGCASAADLHELFDVLDPQCTGQVSVGEFSRLLQAYQQAPKAADAHAAAVRLLEGQSGPSPCLAVDEGGQPGTVLSPLAGLRAWLLQKNWIFQDLELRHLVRECGALIALLLMMWPIQGRWAPQVPASSAWAKSRCSGWQVQEVAGRIGCRRHAAGTVTTDKGLRDEIRRRRKTVEKFREWRYAITLAFAAAGGVGLAFRRWRGRAGKTGFIVATAAGVTAWVVATKRWELKNISAEELINVAFSGPTAELFSRLPSAIEALQGRLGSDELYIAEKVEGNFAMLRRLIKLSCSDRRPYSEARAILDEEGQGLASSEVPSSALEEGLKLLPYAEVTYEEDEILKEVCQERGLQARCPADEPACRYLGNPHRFDRNAKHTVHTQASVRS